MRIGIYLGRHATNSSGMAVYARSLVLGVLAQLEEEGRDEVVFYGDGEFFDSDFHKQLLQTAVPLTVSNRSFDLPARSYLRPLKNGPLKNGVRCKALVRVLPNVFGRWISTLLDHVVVPLLARYDGVQLLHSAVNTAFPLSATRQIATVHDLFQGWLPEQAREDAEEGEGTRPSLLKRLMTQYYRGVFAAQFRRLRHVITVAPLVAEEVKRRFAVEANRITAIPLGVDQSFLEHSQREFVAARARWLKKMEIPEGYVLVLLSRDPRKNTERSIAAWKALSEGERKRGVVFNVLDPKAIPRCRELLGEEFAAEYVYFTRNLPRSEVPFLFSAAQVLLVPSLAEGFGLPALEAVAVGTMVVTTPVDSLAGVQSENVFLCQGEHLSSIQDALHLALNTQKARDRERFQDKAQSKGVRVRTLRDSIRETYTIYRKVGVA